MGTGGSNPPQPCEPGYYCPGAVLENIAGNRASSLDPASCPVGQLCPCPAGRYGIADNLQDWEECLACPPGRFCEGAKTAPDGPCALGHFCPNGTSSANQFPCPPGTYGNRTDMVRQDECEPCPEGHYCTGGLNFFVDCPAGTYANTTGTESALDCIECPAGHYCIQGSVEPTECGTGRHADGSDDGTNFLDAPADGYPGLGVGNSGETVGCELCRRGHHCPSNTTSTASMLASLRCAAGLVCPLGLGREPEFTSHACPAGFYCPEATVDPLGCPARTINPHEGGMSEANDCQPCPAGQYCPIVNQTEPAGLCQPGHYCPERSISDTEIDCPPKFYRVADGARSQDDCALCPSGFYCLNATVNPIPCPEGSYCRVGVDTPTPCRAGTFGNTTGLRRPDDCTPCPPGFYCDTEGLQTPAGECDAGYYCLEGSSSPAPADSSSPLSSEPTPFGGLCPPGGFCPQGSSQPQSCPSGTFSNVTGAFNSSVCRPCPGGFFCQGSSLPFPTGPCEPGFYCPAGSETATAVIAPQGTFTDGADPAPIPCPPGTFNNVEQRASCFDCLAGRFCNDTGMTDPLICTAGSYCPEGTDIPPPCERGTYSSRRGLQNATECTVCEAGLHCPDTGMLEPEGPCDPGFYCTGGAILSNPGADSVTRDYGGPCPVGHYCPAETKFATEYPCPPGTINPVQQRSNDSACLSCPPGSYCEDPGQSEPAGPCAAGFFCSGGSSLQQPPDGSVGGGPCTVGHYCPVNTSSPLQCPSSTFMNSTGASECYICPEGYFCDGSTPAQPQPCPIGSYCPAGTGTTPPLCPEGTYNSLLLLTSASECQPCPPGRYCGTEGLTTSGGSGPCAPGFYCPQYAAD